MPENINAMAGINIYVKDEQQKSKLIEDYLAADNDYIRTLEAIKEEMQNNGIDINSAEGRKQFVLKVRELNKKIGNTLHIDLP